MTARRAARHPKVSTLIDGYDVPPELLDPDHIAWHGRAAHIEFMDAHGGWALDVRDRFGGGSIDAPPAARRQAAAEGWAEDRGITTSPGGHADYHRMAALGIYP